MNGIEELLQDINVSSFKTDPIGTAPVQVSVDSFRILFDKGADNRQYTTSTPRHVVKQ